MASKERMIAFACGETADVPSYGGTLHTKAVVDGKDDSGVFGVYTYEDWISVLAVGNNLRITVKPFVGTDARNVSPDVSLSTEYSAEDDPTHRNLIDLEEREGVVYLVHVADSKVSTELKVTQKAETYSLVVTPNENVEFSTDVIFPCKKYTKQYVVKVNGGHRNFRVKNIRKKRQLDTNVWITMTNDNAVVTEIKPSTNDGEYTLEVSSYGRVEIEYPPSDIVYEITLVHTDRPRLTHNIEVTFSDSGEETVPAYSGGTVSTFAASPSKQFKKRSKKAVETFAAPQADNSEPNYSIEVLGAKDGVLDFGNKASAKTLFVNTEPRDAMVTAMAVSDYVFCEVDRHKVHVRIEDNPTGVERRCMVYIRNAEKYDVRKAIIIRQGVIDRQ